MSLATEIKAHNRAIDEFCQQQWGISVEVYQVIKILTQLVGALAGIYALTLGAEPIVIMGMITVIISGPQALEYFMVNGGSNE